MDIKNNSTSKQLLLGSIMELCI